MSKFLGVLLLFSLLFISPVFAELPDVTTLEDITLDPGVHFIRPESKYVVPTSSRPHFLSVDSANFIACIEEDVQAEAFLVCLDNNNFKEVDLQRWPQQDYCFVGGSPLSDFDCQNAVVQVEYLVNDENLKISEEFIIDTFSTVVDKLINAQYSDGGWQTSLDTAFAVLALSYFDEIFTFEMDKALSWLKLNRNDDLKCWPEAPCSLKQTASILALLTESGIDDPYRVINDGRNFLEERQNYYEQEDSWSVVIEDVSVQTTLSLVAIDSDLLDENFSIPANGTKRYNFSAVQSDNLTILADQNVGIRVYNQRNDEIYEFQGDNFTFSIPGACWSLNLPGEACNTGTTAYALSSNLSEHRTEEGIDFMKTQLSRGVIRYHYGLESDPIESALYVKNVYDDSLLDDNPSDDDQDETYFYDVLQWVLFNQRNDGYWGEEFDGDEEDEDFEDDRAKAYTEQLKKTAFVVLSLLDSGFNRSSEPIVDAKEWVTSIEDDINQSSGSALGAAFYIVRNNAYPLLYTDPSVIIIDKQVVDVQFINPTPFNYRELTYTLSPSVQEYVSIEEKTSLGAYNYRNIKFTKTKAITDTVYGFVSVGNVDQEIARIPILVQDAPTLTMTSSQSTSVFGRSGSITLTATKSKHVFNCDAIWDSDEVESTSFKLSESKYNLPLTFTQAITKEDVYKGTVTCKNSGQEFEFPLSVSVKRYAAKPITVFPTSVTFNDTQNPPSILIQNNLDVDLVVSVLADRFSNELLFSQDVFLRPGSSENFSVRGVFDPLINYSGSSKLTFTTLETSESVNMLIDITSKPESASGVLALLITLIFITAIIGTGGFLAYKYRDDLLKYINKIPLFQSKAEIQKQKKSLDTLRSDEKNKAISNMYSIMKFQQASDEDIKKKLLGAFSKDEIIAALQEEGILLEGLDETEPEKV